MCLEVGERHVIVMSCALEHALVYVCWLGIYPGNHCAILTEKRLLHLVFATGRSGPFHYKLCSLVIG